MSSARTVTTSSACLPISVSASTALASPPPAPRFMAYIPGGAQPYSALGDLLAAVSNKYSGFASASPGAVRIENACVRFLADAIGYPEGAGGTLTSGGSIANLTAMVAARDARDPDGGGAIYTTRFAHYCVDKAIRIAGRAQAPRRVIATDASTAWTSAALEAAMERDKATAFAPWLVVASAGTVDTGAIDPLAEIADLCRRYRRLVPCRRRLWRAVRLVRRGPRAAARDRPGRQRRARPAQDPVPALWHGRLPGPRRAPFARRVQRLGRLYPAAGRVRGRAVAGRSVARADPPFPRACGCGCRCRSRALPRSARRNRKSSLWRAISTPGWREIDGFDPGPEPELSVVAFRYGER